MKTLRPPLDLRGFGEVVDGWVATSPVSHHSVATTSRTAKVLIRDFAYVVTSRSYSEHSVYKNQDLFEAAIVANSETYRVCAPVLCNLSCRDLNKSLVHLSGGKETVPSL